MPAKYKIRPFYNMFCLFENETAIVMTANIEDAERIKRALTPWRPINEHVPSNKLILFKTNAGRVVLGRNNNTHVIEQESDVIYPWHQAKDLFVSWMLVSE